MKDDREWAAAGLRAAIVFLCVAAVNATILYVKTKLGLCFTWHGLVNLALIDLILIWYLLDLLLERRAIYRLFGQPERVPVFEVRFWRKIILATSLLGGVSAAGVALYPQPGVPAPLGEPSFVLTLPTDLFGPMFILVGAYVAAVGWMYTTFEKEKSDRAANTLQVIRDHIFGDYVSSFYVQYQKLTSFVQKLYLNNDKTVPIPVDLMATRLDRLPDDGRPEGYAWHTLEHIADEVFNSFDHMALGVRLGQFDFKTIKLLHRARILRGAFVFSDYIRDQTKATWDPKAKRYRSTISTWEHFLWLVSKLDVHERDQIDPAKLVLPPARIPSATNTIGR